MAFSRGTLQGTKRNPKGKRQTRSNPLPQESKWLTIFQTDSEFMMIYMTVSRATGLVLFCTPATWSSGIRSIVSGKREAGRVPRMNKTMSGLNQDQWVSQQWQLPTQGCWEGALSTDGKQLSGNSKWHSCGFLCSLVLLRRVSSLHSGSHMVPPFPKGREGWSSLAATHYHCRVPRHFLSGAAFSGNHPAGAGAFSSPLFLLAYR